MESFCQCTNRRKKSNYVIIIEKNGVKIRICSEWILRIASTYLGETRFMKKRAIKILADCHPSLTREMSIIPIIE